jgi:hypothetical protein
VTLWTDIDVAEPPPDARIQASSESPTALVVNGVELGRQSAFDPQSYSRMTRVHPYDLSGVLRVGTNRVEVRITDTGRPAAFRLDSVPRESGGLGMLSDGRWAAERDGVPIPVVERLTQYEDPRYGCIVPRPHPLQASTWLDEGACDTSVLSLIPDLAPEDGRVETLTFVLPVGTVSFTVPTSEPFEVDDGGVDGTVVHLARPAGAGETATLRFRPSSGRRGGALLDGPVTVSTTRVIAPLLPWESLGLGAMGGEVSYRTSIAVPSFTDDERVILNLGQVRGTVEVRVGAIRAGSLFAGPWLADLTEAVIAGERAQVEVIVRGTLAPYLDVASPTSAIAAGQKVAGLIGPVSVEVWS